MVQCSSESESGNNVINFLIIFELTVRKEKTRPRQSFSLPPPLLLPMKFVPLVTKFKSVETLINATECIFRFYFRTAPSNLPSKALPFVPSI